MSSPFEFDRDRPPYDRQSWESRAAYQHFQAYAQLPYDPANRHADGRPGPRTLKLVAEARDVSLSTIKTHSAEKRWAERAEEYDRAQALEETRAIREAERFARNENARRRIAARSQMFELFGDLMDRAAEVVKFPLFEDSEPELVEGPDGEFIYSIVRTPLEDVTPASAAVYLREARAFFSVALADPDGALDDLLDAIDYDALTPEQQQQIADGENPIKVVLQGRALSGAGARRVGEEQEGDW